MQDIEAILKVCKCTGTTIQQASADVRTFHIGDVDGNGELDLREFRELLDSQGVHAHSMGTLLFTMFDVDSSG